MASEVRRQPWPQAQMPACFAVGICQAPKLYSRRVRWPQCIGSEGGGPGQKMPEKPGLGQLAWGSLRPAWEKPNTAARVTLHLCDVCADWPAFPWEQQGIKGPKRLTWESPAWPGTSWCPS